MPTPSLTTPSTPSIQTVPLQTPRKAPVAPVVRETPRSKPHLPIASNGKLVDVIDCTPMPSPSIQTVPLQTPRKAPVVREPIASNGKLVDVIQCTPTQRPRRRQPTQNVAIQEKGKFVSHISLSLIAFQIDLLEVPKQVAPLLI